MCPISVISILESTRNPTCAKNATVDLIIMVKKSEIAKADAAQLQPLENIENLIHVIRGKQVMLDRDLARLYGVETFRLNEQVKRNKERFPDDFMFQLSKDEFENWKSQIAISIPTENMSSQNARTSNPDMLSQIAMTSAKRRPLSALPYAFTENGIAMLSGVLRSQQAININIQIMRAFNAMRHFIASNAQVFQRQYTYQCNVVLPYKSLVHNQSYELYEYVHYNKLPRSEKRTCPFCDLSRRVGIICETDMCVAFYDGYPVSPGHALIIPRRHVASYFDLTMQEREAMNNMLSFVKQKVDEQYHPDGYNIGINVNEAAGQSVFYCHMHLIPRYKGDVENPKGGVRGVIPNKQKY